NTRYQSAPGARLIIRPLGPIQAEVATLPAVWLVARALPTRPALTGAAYGLAVGLMTDAGLRLFCPIDQSLHVVAGHGGAILLGAVGGAIADSVSEGVEYRRLQEQAARS